MTEQKVSELTELAAGDLDPSADWLLVSDMSALTSKKMKPAEMIRASLPYLTTAWDFTTGSLLPTVSFTRASTGYRYNSAGVLVPEATDVARFQYDPVTLTPRGLLVESAGTNILTYSEDFSNAAWGKTNITVTANAVAAPDGATTADAFVENGATAGHNSARSATYLNATTYVHSVYAKQDTRTWLYIYTDPGRFGGAGFTFFNLATGTVGTTSAGVTASMTLEANGFYRCVAIATTTSAGAANFAVGLSTGDGVLSHAGDGVSKLYVWGACIVADAVRSSYIQTVASTATRSADVALVTNANAISDQCWIIRGRTPRKISGGAANIILQVDDGTINNARRVYYEAGNYLCVSAVVDGGTTCFFNLGVIANDTDFTVAVRWADNNFAVSLNGGAVVTDPSGANPLGLTTARIGSGVSGGHWNSTIRTIETRRTASDAELPLLAA